MKIKVVYHKDILTIEVTFNSIEEWNKEHATFTGKGWKAGRPTAQDVVRNMAESNAIPRKNNSNVEVICTSCGNKMKPSKYKTEKETGRWWCSNCPECYSEYIDGGSKYWTRKNGGR